MPIYAIKRVNNVSAEYRDNIIMGKSNHSYCMNRKITEVLNTNSWLGRRCFIIGGGESLRGFDFSRLNGELTIGINKAFKHYPNSTINYCMDSVFYDQMHRGEFDKPGEVPLIEYWKKYGGTRVFITPMERRQFNGDVLLVRRNIDPSVNRENLEQGIHPGTNSGTGALTLAAALGASPIYLLGYDMAASTSTHWHEGYEKRDLTEFSRKLDEYRQDIEKISPLLAQAGITVVNLNRSSGLRCFPFGDIDSIIGAKHESNL